VRSRVLARSSPPSPADQAIYLRVEHRLVRVSLDDILFVEACENYVRVHTAAKVHMTKRTMREMETELGTHGFRRVHRSYLVNLRRVDRVDADGLVVAGRRVPVGRRLREGVVAALRVV